MIALGVILARAGSKGVPGKCTRELLGRPLIDYTFDHAFESRLLTARLLTTDSPQALALARQRGIETVERSAELATDSAPVDAAARHAVRAWESRSGSTVDVIVLLYGNVPIRPIGAIDRAIALLTRSGADSVRTVALISKLHPDWLHRVDGDRLIQYRTNSIHRRQDLEPLYYHDGAVIAVTRRALFDAEGSPHDPHAFFGADRRALVVRSDEAVDIDEPADLLLAETMLRSRGHAPAAPGKPRPSASVSIAGRAVGPCSPALIVAEIGVNHDGCVEKALRLVDAAADTGADAIKLQWFRADELTTASASTAKYQKDHCGQTSQQSMLAALELSARDVIAIRNHCSDRGLLFWATPFSTAGVEQLLKLDVPCMKLASPDLTNVALLDAVVATKRPVILSTGASTPAEIARTVSRFVEHDAVDRLILLHCVSAYPTSVDAINLGAIRSLREAFGVPVGLSDHTTSTDVGGWAVAAGACVLEKHLTLDRGSAGPDHAMSLDPPRFRAYVRNARSAEQALGSSLVGMTELESEVRHVAGRSLVTRESIAQGTLLTADLFTSKRPGDGVAAWSGDMLANRRASCDIAADTVLTWDMLE